MVTKTRMILNSNLITIIRLKITVLPHIDKNRKSRNIGSLGIHGHIPTTTDSLFIVIY